MPISAYLHSPQPGHGGNRWRSCRVPSERHLELLGKVKKPIIEAEEFIACGAEWLAVDIAELRSRRRAEGLVWARELMMILGVERFGLKVKDLARQMRKFPDGMTQAIARAEAGTRA